MSLKGIATLASSRKFWITAITAGGMVYLFAKHQVSADMLAGSLAALGGVLTLAIAHEDAGTGGGANQPPAAPGAP